MLSGHTDKRGFTDFYVQARRESTDTYHIRDFKLHIDSQDSPRHAYDNRAKRESSPRTNLTQSEHDWAYAKRALARGDEPEEVIRRIADYRTGEKPDPEYYARHTVQKAQTSFESGKARDEPDRTDRKEETELGHDQRSEERRVGKECR